MIKKVEEMYEGTEVTVRTKRGYTERFWTKKGVRQGYVKRKIGGIEVGKIRVWNLAYAGDFVVIAKNRETLIDMMDTFKRFLKERKLTLWVERTKILIFNRRKKEGREEWKWGKRK